MLFRSWRLVYRRRMLEAESEANAKAVDSLLNYETVKYFGNEAHEARRFDVSLSAYERAAVWSANTLSLLNIGQAAIIAIGVTLVMLLAGAGVARGEMTVGDFVMVNASLIQLYLPLNFLGMVYRNLRQSLIDMRAMFKLLQVEAEIEDDPDARPLAVTDNMNFGNPQKPEIMGQFAGAITGMAEACKALDFPVVSGNVSLYNETEGRPILPKIGRAHV